MNDKTKELVNLANERRNFEILQRGRALDDASRARNRSAIAAGLCFLGAASLVIFSGKDAGEVLQHEVNAIYSWQSLGQYLQDLGPATTILSAATGGFIARYFQNSRRIRRLQNEHDDMDRARQMVKSDNFGGKK